MIIEWLGTLSMLIGMLFFLAGTIGVLRFPDVYSRLHVLAKVDNLGLGFVVLGLLPQTTGFAEALKLVLIWMLVLMASSLAGLLIARRAHRRGIEPWSAE